MNETCQVRSFHQAWCQICDWTGEITVDQEIAEGQAGTHRADPIHLRRLSERSNQDFLYGIAPDGSTVAIPAATIPDEETCPETWGLEGKLQAWCTQPAHHPGPWHIASTGAAIVKIWPVAS